MCCVVTTLMLLGPRLAIVVWWLLQPARWSIAFSSMIWPIVGFLFLPWTTLMYVLVIPGGLSLVNWIFLVLALIVDLGSYGSGYQSRTSS